MNAKRETAQVGPRRSLQAPPISLIQNSGNLRRLRCSSVIQRTSQIESEPPTVAQRLIPFRAHLPTNRRGATVASRLRRRAADRLSRTVEELDGTPAGARGRHRHGRQHRAQPTDASSRLLVPHQALVICSSLRKGVVRHHLGPERVLLGCRVHVVADIDGLRRDPSIVAATCECCNRCTEDCGGQDGCWEWDGRKLGHRHPYV